MNIINSPVLFNDALNDRGLFEDLYGALRTLDMTGAVMIILRVLRNTNTLPHVQRSNKISNEACSYRHRGNAFYRDQQYRRALEYYNKALLWAPKDSTELILAYSNRSALFFKLEAYGASLNDIEICFKLQCTDSDLLDKLTKRKEECEMLIWKENENKSIPKNSFTEGFFKVKGKTHREIPCLSASVDIVSESGEIRAVAAKDIAVGTVLAVETAFTTYSELDKSFLTCHYCQKMALNLFPCDNCCHALFCSKKCKKLCLSEYHLIECQIMDILQTLDRGGSRFQLAIKTALKLKTQCRQWSTLIKESENIGANRLKTSSINEIYDVKNYSSILSFNEDRHFIHGALYNSCIRHATVIHYLQDISGFYPYERKNCLEAQKCLAKLFTSLELLWPSSTEIENVAADVKDYQNMYNLPCHYGWFAFTSKLKHFCEPNVLVLGLDNQVGLVAVQPIKKKKELKISYLGHWATREYERNKRTEKIFRKTFNVCTCRICKEGWNSENVTEGHFNHLQLLALFYWTRLEQERNLMSPDESYFKETCKAVTMLGNQPHTREYCTVFTFLCVQLNICQLVFSNNYRITDCSPSSPE